MKSSAVLIVVALWAAPVWSQAMWSDMSAYQHELIDIVLPAAGQVSLSEADVNALMLQRGTRASSYLSIGYLMRNQNTDAELARTIVRKLLDLQDDRPGEDTHGLWPTSVDLTRDRVDMNWREFVGTALIVAREIFPERLGEEIVGDIDRAIHRAAEGAAARDVNPGYTNIALMSAFLMDTAGHFAPESGLREKGLQKARAIFELFSEHNTFLEYNSPTYYGVNLIALGMWRELAKSSELSGMARQMEVTLWKDIGQFYHAGLKTMCGPHARAYGMDMTRYTALTGLAIAFVLDDPEMAPIPGPTEKRVMHEWAYTILYGLLGLPVPDEVVTELRTFSGARDVERKVSYRGQLLDVQASLHEHWMVGASNGMIRPWDQHYPATLHWRAPTGKTSWLLVSGTSGVTAVLREGRVDIAMPQREPERPVRILLEPTGIDLSKLSGDRWDLPGMSIQLDTALDDPVVSRIDDRRLGKVVEVAWPVRAALPATDILLTLTPKVE